MQVSLTTLHNLEEYRLGFSAAIIHDLFNWCTVIYIIYTLYLHMISTHYIYNIYRCTILVLLPIEIGTGFLEKLTGRISFLYTLCSSLKSTVSTVYKLQKYMLDTYFSKLNLLKLNFILQHFKTILNTNTNPIIANYLFDFSKCLPFVKVLKMQFSNLFGWVAEWVAALVHVLVRVESM